MSKPSNPDPFAKLMHTMDSSKRDTTDPIAKALASRMYVRTDRIVKADTNQARPAGSAGGLEYIDSRELAHRWSVSKRWIDDQTRSKDDPIPAFKRGKIVRYLWNANDTQNALNLWWSRHTKVQTPSRKK